MNKTIIKVLVALVACAIIVFAFKAMNKPEVEAGEKTLTIKIVDGDKEVATITENTDAELLADVLTEMAEEKDIVLEYQDSEYGMYITGLGVDELLTEAPSENKYWMYNSENNRSCKEAGFCTGASELPVYDGDEFEFTLSVFSY